MTRPLIRIHNAETDEIIERELNDEEFARYEANRDAEKLAVQEAEIKAEAKAALLNRLGITEEEAKLLLS